LCRIRSTSVISSRNTHSLSTLSKELCYTEQSSYVTSKSTCSNLIETKFINRK
jgi:hypothetical protein